MVVVLSKEGKQSLAVKAYEWTHQHCPNVMGHRPVDVRRAIEAAEFEVKRTHIEQMSVAVEIVLAIQPSRIEARSRHEATANSPH